MTVQGYSNDDFQNPHLVCDLVMKGGITSGVVYPPAILKLATKYRFRSIGGTSVGAMVAVTAAAAEYNREKGGFVKLYEAQQRLSEKDFVRNLFQPAQESRAAMETLLAVAGEKGDKPGVATQDREQKLKNDLWFLLPLRVRQFLKLQEYLFLKDPKVVAAGALAGMSLPFGWAWFVGGRVNRGRRIIPLLLGWLGALLAGIFHLGWILFNKVPRDENFYGMCIGHKDSPGGPEVLTDWLSDQINYVAGEPRWQSDTLNEKPLGNPLTFGHLARKQINGEGITLQLVSTNLSQSEPYIFPRAEMNLVFKEAEMRKFFPDYVVDYMAWAARQKSQTQHEEGRNFVSAQQKRSFHTVQQEKSQSNEIALPNGYYFLPAWYDLPVVVAARMSLCYPILLCAVPLYTINSSALERIKRESQAKLEEADLQRNWFSDGGISSNFPIHFFDAWLPRYPTFGINLTSLPKQSQNKNLARQDENKDQDGIPRSAAALHRDATTATDFNQRVLLPKAKDAPDPEYSEIQGLLGFINAIIGTMQNYHDNMQSRLPSYRERIVQIRFDNEREGGLNLAMDSTTIERIEEMGEKAAEKLLPGSEFNFEEHKWVRLRVLMNQLEEQLKTLEQGYPDLRAYAKVLDEQLEYLNDSNSQFYCSEDKGWCVEAKKRLTAFITLMDCWKKANASLPDAHFFAQNPPEPGPILRTTPTL